MVVEDGEGGEGVSVHNDHLTPSESNIQEPITVVKCRDAHFSYSGGVEREEDR